MASGVLRDQIILFDGYNLTTRTNSLAVEYGCESQDDTVFGDATRSNLGGLKTVSFSAEGLYDALPYDAGLFSTFGASNKVITYGTSATEGDPAYTLNAMTSQYTPIRGSVGDIIGFTLAAGSTKSPLVRGTVLANKTGIATTGNGTVFQTGAVASGQTLYAALHVTNVVNAADSLQIIVQSNATGTFSGSEVTRVTFTAANAVGSQWLTLAGPVTHQYWRARWSTVTGAAPSFNFVVVIGIL